MGLTNPPPSPDPGGILKTQPDPRRVAFDKMYWDSLESGRKTISEDSMMPRKWNILNLMAQSRLIVTYEIDWLGMSPYVAMTLWRMYGYTWVPNLFDGKHTIQNAPGLWAGGELYDPSLFPAGSLRVSLDAKDYPAYAKPTPIAPTKLTVVGPTIHIGGKMWAAGVDDKFEGGYVYVRQSDGVQFVKRMVPNPFGFSVFYEEQ